MFKIATFDPAQVIAIISAITAIVQLLKKGIEKLEEMSVPGSFAHKVYSWWSHTVGPVILSTVVSVLAVLPDIAQDGKLTWVEAAKILGLITGSNGAYLILRKFAFTKK